MPVEFSVRKVYGPAKIEGRFYRVVEFVERKGGHGMCGEVWGKGKWVSYDDGPGCKAIIAGELATESEMWRFGVDWSLPNPEYDPMAVDSD